MFSAQAIDSFPIFDAEVGNIVEFYTRLESSKKRYIGQIESASYKYLTVFHIVPAPGFEDRFPNKDPKLVVVTDTFIIRVLDADKKGLPFVLSSVAFLSFVTFLSFIALA